MMPEGFNPNKGARIGPGWRALRDLALDMKTHTWQEALLCISEASPSLSSNSVRGMMYWAKKWGLISWEGTKTKERTWWVKDGMTEGWD